MNAGMALARLRRPIWHDVAQTGRAMTALKNANIRFDWNMEQTPHAKE